MQTVLTDHICHTGRLFVFSEKKKKIVGLNYQTSFQQTTAFFVPSRDFLFASTAPTHHIHREYYKHIFTQPA